MQKYGFREGQGLGKHEQGLSTALSVEKTSKRGGKIIIGDLTEKGGYMHVHTSARLLRCGLLSSDVTMPMSIQPEPIRRPGGILQVGWLRLQVSLSMMH